MKMKLDGVHLVDMVELHTKTGDMLYRGVLQYVVSVNKMKNMVVNIDKKLKQEKLATKAKQNQITKLEKKIVVVSAHPKNSIFAWDLIEKNDNEIKVLKKKLNVPDIQHV
jgi:hypothetical protein